MPLPVSVRMVVDSIENLSKRGSRDATQAVFRRFIRNCYEDGLAVLLDLA
jgi:hypothetical protein